MLLATCSANADVVQGLYRAKVAVNDQSARAQTRAIQQAFRDVMVKVSGSRELLAEPVIKNSINNAGQYLRQYQFDSHRNQQFFVAEFDAPKIDRLLIDAGLPIWGSYRPSVLLWIADETPQLEKILYTEYSTDDFKIWLHDASERRGLSINFPIVKLDDSTDSKINTTVYDVWGRFSDNIIAASEPYAPEVVMSVRVYQQRQMTKEFQVQVPDSYLSPVPFLDDSDQLEQSPQPEKTPEVIGYQADWFIAYGNHYIDKSFQADSKSQLAALLIDALADELASTFAVQTAVDIASNQASETFITLNNINSIGAYVAAQNYFTSLQAVTDIQLRTLNGVTAVFQVSLIGQEQNLINTLRLDDKVQRVTDAFGRPTQALEFVWIP